MVKLDGKVVIITGSSSGIGQAAAVAFAAKGASVTIHGRSIDGLQRTIKLLKAKKCDSDRILMVQGNIENKETCHKLIDDTIEKFGRIDILVNNAGIAGKQGEKDPLSIENYEYTFDVNLKSVIIMTKLATPYLQKTKGNIVNISSVAGIRASSFFPYYSMAKAGLDHFCRNMSSILAEKGIRINNLNPGGTETDFQSKIAPNGKEMVSQWAKKNVPMGRMGTSQEMAKAIVFIATEATYMTGSTIVIDGGVLHSNDFKVQD
uniref:Uncharacterized protein n=1 Tax=Acrobeloides nanus TaxID=290746 RepID=A0A914DVM2_9BILA